MQDYNEENVRHNIRLILSAGVLASAALMAAGLIAAAAGFSGRPLINAGLLILLLTPLARVTAAAAGFAAMRRYRYALVSALVLLMLGAEFVLNR